MDTKYFNQAFLEYATTTGFDGRFFELSLQNQIVILQRAQQLKVAELDEASDTDEQRKARIAFRKSV